MIFHMKTYFLAYPSVRMAKAGSWPGRKKTKNSRTILKVILKSHNAKKNHSGSYRAWILLENKDFILKNNRQKRPFKLITIFSYLKILEKYEIW